MEDVGIFYIYSVYFIDIQYILRPIGIFYGHFVYSMVIWYIFPVLVCCNKKNLATLHFKPIRFFSKTASSAVSMITIESS
jgi:hypothetical protein